MKKEIILLSISTILLLTGCKPDMSKMKKDETALVSTATPFEKEFNKEIEFNGIVEAPKTIEIKNRTAGFIQKQYFKDGSYVKKGDLLYKMDDRELKTELSYAKAQLAVAEQESINLSSIYDKTQNAYKIGGVSKQELETSLTNLMKAKANMNMIKANIEKINLSISFTNITATESGYIERSKQNEGSYVSISSEPLTSIYMTNNLHFTAMIPATEKTFDSNQIEINGIKTKGSLDYCDPTTDLSSGLVKCRFKFQTKEKIEINSIGKIKFETKAKGLFIPQSALVQTTEGKSVYLYSSKNIATAQKIKTGVWSGTDIEIISGLTDSSEVITNGIANVRDQGPVKKGNK